MINKSIMDLNMTNIETNNVTSAPNDNLPPILQDILDNQAVSDPVFYTLVTLYSMMIIGSVLGNIMVITAVLKAPNMRKVNNILIVNLAISDLLLCTVVSPLTLIEILYKRWMGPKLQWLCHLSAMGPVCITFVSTLTITGIAIDRYKIIVYAKSQAQPKLSTAIVSLVVIWFLSVALSFPLYFAMNLEIIKMPDVVVKTIGETSIAYCAEKWGQYEKGRLVVSLFSMLVQFILPITLISWAHHAIKRKLQNLPSWNKSTNVATHNHCEKNNSTAASNQKLLASSSKENNDITEHVVEHKSLNKCKLLGIHKHSQDQEAIQMDVGQSPKDDPLEIQNNRLREKLKKQSRTHALLVSIVVMFALSWFPLNVLNIILDIHNIFESEQASRICFAFCHLIGMSSAFSNPILYGWFNEAFRDEFKNIARSIFFCDHCDGNALPNPGEVVLKKNPTVRNKFTHV